MRVKGADEKRNQVLLKKITIAKTETKKAEMAKQRKSSSDMELKKILERKISETHLQAEKKHMEL